MQAARFAAMVFLLLSPLGSGAPARARAACLDIDLTQLSAEMEAAQVVVIALVDRAAPESEASLVPEVYLKGPARPGAIELTFPDPRPRCPLAAFEAGMRVLAFLAVGQSGTEWPGAGDVFILRDGRAIASWPAPVDVPETQLVSQIRSLTGQFAVPARTADERATIDWAGTVLPIGLVVLALFAAGLVLMRVWHRIDPS